MRSLFLYVLYLFSWRLYFRVRNKLRAKKNQNSKRRFRSVFLVTPIARFSKSEVAEELRNLWKIELCMDEVVKTKKLKREKSDIVQRRRKGLHITIALSSLSL